MVMVLSSLLLVVYFFGFVAGRKRLSSEMCSAVAALRLKQRVLIWRPQGSPRSQRHWHVPECGYGVRVTITVWGSNRVILFHHLFGLWNSRRCTPEEVP